MYPIHMTFKWTDRAGAILWASAEYRNARRFGEPISLSDACGRTIGYGEPAMAGKFCTTPAIGDTRWNRFKADVEKDIVRVDDINRTLSRKTGSS